MSCCGSPRSPQDTGSSSGGTLHPFPISDQPSPHPRIDPFPEKQSARNPPSISPPPPAHTFSRLTANQPSPLPSSTTHGSTTSSPPPQSSQIGTFSNGSTADAAGSTSTVQRPNPSYPTSGNPNLLSTYQSSAPIPASLPLTDEGKMSVAIDFGERHACTTCCARTDAYGSGTTFSGVVSVFGHLRRNP